MIRIEHFNYAVAAVRNLTGLSEYTILNRSARFKKCVNGLNKDMLKKQLFVISNKTVSYITISDSVRRNLILSGSSDNHRKLEFLLSRTAG